jgi:hypothetical protein
MDCPNLRKEDVEKILAVICRDCDHRENIDKIVAGQKLSMIRDLIRARVIDPKTKEGADRQNKIERFHCRAIIQEIEILCCKNCYYTIVNCVVFKMTPHRPTDEELAENYCADTKDGGMTKYRKKWPEIEGEIDSEKNKWGTGEEYGKASAEEGRKKSERFWYRCLHYLKVGGLIHFWETTETAYDHN